MTSIVCQALSADEIKMNLYSVSVCMRFSLDCCLPQTCLQYTFTVSDKCARAESDEWDARTHTINASRARRTFRVAQLLIAVFRQAGKEWKLLHGPLMASTRSCRKFIIHIAIRTADHRTSGTQRSEPRESEVRMPHRPITISSADTFLTTKTNHALLSMEKVSANQRARPHLLQLLTSVVRRNSEPWLVW